MTREYYVIVVTGLVASLFKMFMFAVCALQFFLPGLQFADIYIQNIFYNF